jgi:hypothetical protein
MMRETRGYLVIVAVIGAVLGGVAAHKALAVLGSAQGDIPDTQVFVTYRSAPGGYALEVPEGWGRMEQGPNVLFISALNGLEVTIRHTAVSPTLASIRDQGVAALKQTEPGVAIQNMQTVRFPSGPAVRVAYTSTSTLDPVTGKRTRLENQAYLFSKKDAMATLRLWAPVGADNVDQWQRMARSFRWL